MALSRLNEDVPGRAGFRDFVERTPHLTDNDKTAEPSMFLIERASTFYDEMNDAVKAQEAKATTILGFVGGGASLIAVTSTSTVASHPVVTALLALALIYFMATLVACLYCLAGRPRIGYPVLRDQFCSPEMLDDPNMTKARLAAYFYLLTEDRINNFRYINATKAYFVELGQQFFALGVFALIANFGVSVFAPTSSVGAIMRCQTSGATLGASNSLTCTTNSEATKP
jgi:hypothetical protein